MSNVVWISSESAWRRRLTKLGNGSMADLDFETRLERMFAQPPALADADAFARRVESKLDRSWMVRRWAIGAAGLVGGVVATGQVLSTNLTERMQGISA